MIWSFLIVFGKGGAIKTFFDFEVFLLSVSVNMQSLNNDTRLTVSLEIF